MGRIGGRPDGKKVEERREAQLANYHAFVTGLLALRDGEDEPDAEAALDILAETLLLHRKYLLAHVKT